jgi:alpha/beta superfamily hydrolase
MRARFLLDTMNAVLHGLQATRLRTALAVLGVSFGVAAVMAVLARTPANIGLASASPAIIPKSA